MQDRCASWPERAAAGGRIIAREVQLAMWLVPIGLGAKSAIGKAPLAKGVLVEAGDEAVAGAGAERVGIDFLESQSNRVEDIMQAGHASEKLVQLGGNALEDYQAVQPLIRQIVDKGTRIELGTHIEIRGFISGQEVVVTGRELNGIFRIADAWVQTVRR